MRIINFVTGPQPKVQPEGVQGKQIEPLHIDIIDLTMEHTRKHTQPPYFPSRLV